MIPTKGDQGPGAAYNGSAKFYQVYDGDTAKQHDLRISHIGYDRKHTTATDSGTWFPLPQLLKAAAAGRIGEVAPRFFGAPTNRSHRVTIDVDAPDILARCQADKVDVAVIVPNCPVCHQTSALVARHLEANGIPTVVMGCAKDIVEHAAAPRFLFSDFPLGNSAGKPQDVDSQALTLELALRSAGVRVRRAHHDAVAAALERGCLLEARLQQHRADEPGRTGAAPRRVRQAERDRARQPGGVIASSLLPLWETGGTQKCGRMRGSHRAIDARGENPSPVAALREAATALPQGEREEKAGGRPFDPTVRRREDSRLHAGAGWPLCELPARAARRRRHQGGAARRRGHAAHAAEPRMGRARPRAGLAGHQRQQAQPDARSRKSRRRSPSSSSSPRRPTW